MFRKKKSTREMVMNDTTLQDSSPSKKQSEKRSKPNKVSGSPFQNKTLLGFICIIAALFVAFGLTPMMDAINSNTSDALRLKSNITRGEVITADHLEKAKIHMSDYPGTVLTDYKKAVGKYAALELQKGDVLTTQKVTSNIPSDDPYLANLPVGKLALSVSMANNAESVAGKLRAGDVVRLYAYLNNTVDNGNYQALSLPELQYIEVLAVTNEKLHDLDKKSEKKDDSPSDQEKSDKVISTLTLAVNAQQAALLSGLNNSAILHSALVVRGNPDAKMQALERQDAFFSSLQQIPDQTQSVPNSPDAVTPSANMGAAQ